MSSYSTGRSRVTETIAHNPPTNTTSTTPIRILPVIVFQCIHDGSRYITDLGGRSSWRPGCAGRAEDRQPHGGQ